ncbi:MAG: MotA/TolQ/ExbB proton channel family protein, partial [Myxococcota bacterium]
MKRWAWGTAALLLIAGTARAEEARSVEDLLVEVERMASARSERDAQRLAEFRGAKSRQAELVARERRRLAELERRSQDLENAFETNEREVAEKQETLRQRQGTRGELFGVVRRAAGDLRVALSSSLVSAQLPGRDAALAPIATSKDVPAVDELRALWAALQKEMTRSGDVVRFQAPVVAADGETSERAVVRVGPFTAISEGQFLVWNAEEQVLVELGRQPAGRITGAARRWANGEGLAAMPVDPSRGRILSLLVETPSWSERLSFGGAIGYL